jgi:hypothetical protein
MSEHSSTVLWSLLVTGKTQSTAAFMGIILMAGIVVKNSILLIDFIEAARAKGTPVPEALRGSVMVRTRPIVMTAFGTAVGMLPIALERGSDWKNFLLWLWWQLAADVLNLSDPPICFDFLYVFCKCAGVVAKEASFSG